MALLLPYSALWAVLVLKLLRLLQRPAAYCRNGMGDVAGLGDEAGFGGALSGRPGSADVLHEL
jgi:hypothetical protein